MDTHVKVLGILYIAFGALGALAALVILMIFGGVAGVVGMAGHHDPEARVAIPILGLAGGALAVFLLLLSIPGIAAGVGLLQYREWARILTIVISALNLLNVPIGTALGIYGFWVLLHQQTIGLFAARRTGP